MSGRAGRIGKYRLIAKLEQGGMAEVHLAVAEGELQSFPLRALKVMPKQLLQDPSITEMFLDEARLAVRLSHPNVVQTMEVGEADGSLYLAMELLEGETVHRLCQRASELAEEIPLRAALAIAAGVLQGLHYIHELRDLDGRPLGIVHRDVTPSNLFITTSGTVKLCDFGIAKTQVQNAVTVVGMRKGKLGYLAPEQLAGTSLDGRADVYACGVVLWELVSGRRLWRRGRELGSRAPRLDEVSRALPEGLADLCARALAHDRCDRYESARAMLTDLESVARLVGGPMPPLDLGQWVERLVGEDVKNLRRLTANALRDRRAVDTLDRPTQPPEATSFTLRPASGGRSPRRRVRVAIAVVALAAVGTIALIRGGEGPGRSLGSGPGAPEASTASLSSPQEEAGSTTLRPPSRVRVETRPESAVVLLDGARLSPPFSVEVEEGTTHRLEVSAPGYEPRSYELDSHGDTLLQVELVPMAPLAPAVSGWRLDAPPRPSTSQAPPSDISRASPLEARPLDLSDPWAGGRK